MTDLTDKIAALMEWPKLKGKASSSPYRTWYDYEHKRSNAALARLALAREWISFYPHQAGCPWRGVLNDVTGKQPPCNCGRDQLLAALEEPK